MFYFMVFLKKYDFSILKNMLDLNVKVFLSFYGFFSLLDFLKPCLKFIVSLVLYFLYVPILLWLIKNFLTRFFGYLFFLLLFRKGLNLFLPKTKFTTKCSYFFIFINLLFRLHLLLKLKIITYVNTFCNDNAYEFLHLLTYHKELDH